jgi:hypothetical protein
MTRLFLLFFLSADSPDPDSSSLRRSSDVNRPAMSERHDQRRRETMADKSFAGTIVLPDRLIDSGCVR